MKNFQNKAKIISVSRKLRFVACLALFVWTVALIFFLGLTVLILVKGESFNYGKTTMETGSKVVTLNTAGQVPPIYAVVLGSVQMLLAMMVSLNFFRFFDCLKNGQMFDAQTISRLHAAGQWWLWSWILDFAFVFLGNCCWHAKMAYSFGELFAPLMIIFVAWLLKEAQTLQEEQELTV